jgi:alpha-ribazole phosphatase
MAIELTLIRHAETEWNRKQKYQGHQDISLNSKGKKQAQKLSKYLSNKKIDMIYSSDLKRAYTTAQIINNFHKLKIRKKQGLKELSFGQWEGMTYDEIEKKAPDLLKQWIRNPIKTKPPGGEDLNSFHQRVINTFKEILKQNNDENILVFTHGGVIKVYLCFILNLDLKDYWKFEISSTGRTVINFYGDNCIIKSVNIVEHLIN